MKTKVKLKGTRLERKLKKILEGQGYYVVRSAGSFGIADLVAIKNDRFIMIQVKSSGITSDEIRRITEVLTKCKISFKRFYIADFSNELKLIRLDRYVEDRRS